MQISQALVLVGGRGTRLRTSGTNIALSKAFLPVAGQPLLHWNLRFLHEAGIRRLVIAADKTALLRAAEQVIRRHTCKFTHVDYFQDEGNGVHGIPYELCYLLDEVFIFDCGHSLHTPEHYRQLMKQKRADNIVFSAYAAHRKNPRQPVALKRGEVLGLDDTQRWAIAHPIAADAPYARDLLSHGFAIRTIIARYSSARRLRYVTSSLPPEFDIPEEMKAAQAIYEQYLAKIASI